MVADCMTHACRMHAEARGHLAAGCPYGAHGDVGERERIHGHAAPIRTTLRGEARSTPWFTGDDERDDDFPSGRHGRTRTFRGGCVFLAHDRRGCESHRASI